MQGKEQESEERAGVLHIFLLRVDVGALGEELVDEAEKAVLRRITEGGPAGLQSRGDGDAAEGGLEGREGAGDIGGLE
jgi:hypothetical protein